MAAPAIAIQPVVEPTSASQAPIPFPLLSRMSLRDYVQLALVSFAFRLIFFFLVPVAGFLDASYHIVIGRVMAQGGGMTEPFVWNYLSPPATVVHPSHDYWMPMGSLLVAGATALFGLDGRTSQIPNLILGTLVPLLGAWYAANHGLDRRRAWLAGLIALITGLNPAYWASADPFVAFAVVGSLCLIWSAQTGIVSALGAGVMAGLGALTRADGPLLLLPLLGFSLAERRWLRIAFAIAGFALVFGPWMLRTYAVFGTFTSPAGTRTIWLKEYNDIFRPGGTPFGEWIARTPGEILGERLETTAANLLTLAAYPQFLLAPFTLIGFGLLWRSRDSRAHRMAILYGIALFVVMSFVFAYPGRRGGFAHSLAALVPLFAVATVVGIDRAVAWYGARRRWKNVAGSQRNNAWIFLAGATFIGIGFGIKLTDEWYRWIGEQRAIAAFVQERSRTAIVAVADPGTYTYWSGTPSVVLPNQPLDDAVATLQQYGTEFVALGDAYPKSWEPIVKGDLDRPDLELVGTTRDVKIYRVLPR